MQQLLFTQTAGDPKHNHDCDCCIYQGETNHTRLGAVDVWICPTVGDETVIWRYGEEGDYSSMSAMMLFEFNRDGSVRFDSEDHRFARQQILHHREEKSLREKYDASTNSDDSLFA